MKGRPYGGTLPAFKRKGGLQSGQIKTQKQKRQDAKRAIHEE